MEEKHNSRIWSKLTPEQKELYSNLNTNSDWTKTVQSPMFKRFYEKVCDVFEKNSDKKEHKDE